MCATSHPRPVCIGCISPDVIVNGTAIAWLMRFDFSDIVQRAGIRRSRGAGRPRSSQQALRSYRCVSRHCRTVQHALVHRSDEQVVHWIRRGAPLTRRQLHLSAPIIRAMPSTEPSYRTRLPPGLDRKRRGPRCCAALRPRGAPTSCTRGVLQCRRDGDRRRATGRLASVHDAAHLRTSWSCAMQHLRVPMDRIVRPAR